MSRRCIVAVLVAMVVAVSHGQAVSMEADAARTNTSIRLSLDAYVEVAVQYAEAAGQFGGGVALAASLLAQARSDASPQLHLEPQLRTFVSDSTGNDVDIGIDLGSRFLEIPQNMARKKVAKARVGQAQHRSTRARDLYAVRAQLAYVRALAAQQSMMLCRERLAAAQAANDAWKDMAVSDTDLQDRQLASALAAQHAQEALADAEGLRDACNDQLKGLCGMKHAILEIEALPRYGFPNITLASCLAWWRTHRTDLRAAKEERTMMTDVVRLARYGYWPRARMGIGYDDGRSDSEFDDNPSGLFALFALSIPVWDAGKTKGRIAEACARRDTVSAQITAIESEIPGTVTDAFRQLREAVQAFERMEAAPKPARRLREAKAKLASEGISRMEFDEAQLAFDTHLAAVASHNRACYLAEADLCDALQASRAQLSAGLVDEPISVL
jgi:outer membrane protein TolC